MEKVTGGTHKCGWQHPKLPGGQEQRWEFWWEHLTVGVSKKYKKLGVDSTHQATSETKTKLDKLTKDYKSNSRDHKMHLILE